jgi:alcohol dehydrogenase
MGPFPFGHEFVAEIVELGEAVTGFKVGQRVVVPFQISCGVCERCNRGLTASCSAMVANTPFDFPDGTGPMFGLAAAVGGGWGGAFSDLVRVPFAQSMLVAVPDGVSSEAIASMSDNIPDAWRTVGPQLSEVPRAEVLVVGGGSVGLYAVGIARALGASRIEYVDTDEARCAIAASLGARATQGPLPTRAGRYPITVDASSRPDGLRCALRSVAPGGVCTSIGIYYEDQALPLLEMYGRGVRFHTARANARAVIPAALDLVASGAFRPEQVTTRVAPWSQAIEALLDTPTKLVVSRL